MKKDEWTSIIKPRRSLFSFNFREVLEKKDLLLLFVKRDFIAIYKQTILGPLWFFIEPLLTTLIFTIVFGAIAGIETSGIPHMVYYLAGLTLWNYYAECLKKTSNTFLENQHIFGKVYFPRLVTPLSIVISSLIKYAIQFVLFLAVYFYYEIFTENDFHPQIHLLLLPVLIFILGVLSLSFGMIISSLTTKYRDLKFLVQFGVQLWMYASPIIYPLDSVGGNLKTLLMINPVTGIIEAFKFAFFGVGEFSWIMIAYSSLFTLILFLIATIVFNKTEQNFMDTI